MFVYRQFVVLGLLSGRLSCRRAATEAKGAHEPLPGCVVGLGSQEIRIVFQIQSFHDPPQQSRFGDDLQLSIEVAGICTRINNNVALSGANAAGRTLSVNLDVGFGEIDVRLARQHHRRSCGDEHDDKHNQPATLADCGPYISQSNAFVAAIGRAVIRVSIAFGLGRRRKASRNTGNHFQSLSQLRWFLERFFRVHLNLLC